MVPGRQGTQLGLLCTRQVGVQFSDAPAWKRLSLKQPDTGSWGPTCASGGARTWCSCSSQHFAEPGVLSGVMGLPSNRCPSRATQ